MEQLKLKNYFFLNNAVESVSSLQDWLANQMLHGKDSRARTRFLKIIGERKQEMDSERNRMLEENSVKGKDGKAILLDEKKKETTDSKKAMQYKIKDEKKFQKEYLDYLNEDYLIDVSPSNKETIYGVKSLLLNSDEEFSGRMASLYNEICECFESIK